MQRVSGISRLRLKFRLVTVDSRHRNSSLAISMKYCTVQSGKSIDTDDVACFLLFPSFPFLFISYPSGLDQGNDMSLPVADTTPATHRNSKRNEKQNKTANLHTGFNHTFAPCTWVMTYSHTCPLTPRFCPDSAGRAQAHMWRSRPVGLEAHRSGFYLDMQVPWNEGIFIPSTTAFNAIQ